MFQRFQGDIRNVCFALWTFAIMFFEGGNFALYFPICVQEFGQKYSGTNYGIICLGYQLFNVVNIAAFTMIDPDFENTCTALSVLTFCGFVNLCIFYSKSALRNNSVQI